jgi:hypothetical protein
MAQGDIIMTDVENFSDDGMVITLKGKTNHGKNRIREHGTEWKVLGLPEGVIAMMPTPRFPTIKSLKTGEMRWLDEKNFEIISEREWINGEIRVRVRNP